MITSSGKSNIIISIEEDLQVQSLSDTLNVEDQQSFNNNNGIGPNLFSPLVSI